MKLVATNKATASRAIDLVLHAGVLIETTGKKRNRTFVYQRYLSVSASMALERTQPREPEIRLSIHHDTLIRAHVRNVAFAVYGSD